MQPFSGVSKDFGENESFYIISQQSVCGQKHKRIMTFPFLYLVGRHKDQSANFSSLNF